MDGKVQAMKETGGLQKFLQFIADGGQAYYSGEMFCNEWLRRSEDICMFLDGAALPVLTGGYVIVGVQTSLRDLWYRVELNSIKKNGMETAESGELELLDYLAEDIQRKAKNALTNANNREPVK